MSFSHLLPQVFFVLFFKNSICCLPSLLCLNSNFYLASFLLLSVLFVSLPLMLSFSLSNDLSASSYHISVWSELMLFFVLFTHIQTHTCIRLSRTEGGGGYLYAAYQSAHYRQWCNTQTYTHTRTTDDSSRELPNTRSRRFLCTFTASKDRANLIHNLNFDNFHLSNASFFPTLLFQSTGDANPLA